MSTKTPPGTQVTLPDVFERVRSCGHAAVYHQDGECLLCNQRFNTTEERQVKRSVIDDTGVGLR